ncbi:MAG: hypothetical protein HKM89_10455 [Gemmatimonadales bacterium]|nr:hypothetical protein [Gemmatimonadales bacterium]
MPRLLPTKLWQVLGAAATAVALKGCATGTGSMAEGPVLRGTEPVQATSDSVPTDFRYAPGPAGSYRYYRLDSIEYRFPGASQVQVYGRTAYLTVGIEPRDSAYRVEFQLDSIFQDPGTTHQPALDSLGRVRWVAEMDPAGGLRNFSVSPASPFGENLSIELARRFFPVQPAGGVRAGVVWTDSAEVTVGGVSLNQTERSVTRSAATMTDDSLGIRIESSAVLERRGTSTQTGEVIEAAGSGVDSTAFFLGPDGLFLGGEGKEQLDLLFTIPAVGQDVPVQQVSHYRIARIPLPAER